LATAVVASIASQAQTTARMRVLIIGTALT
jgi:hypothetical protein